MFGLIKKVFIVVLSSIVLTIQNVFRDVIKNARFNLPILIYILMNTIKNFTIIHIHLN